AEYVVARQELCWPIPDDVSDDDALALLVQGVTAWHLLHTSARVRAGETVVVHAAAGGVGSLAVQLAKRAGWRWTASASSPDKQARAIELGADVAVAPDGEGLSERLIESNEGRRVDVVL